MRNNTKKRGIILLAFFVFLSGSMLLAPKQAHAQLPVTDVAAITYEQGKDIASRVATKLKEALVTTVTSSLINVMTYIANTAAYNAAVNIASGGDADLPLFDPRPPEDYFRYVGMSVVNEAIGIINEENIDGGLLEGYNLCVPLDPYVLLSYRVGLRRAYERPELTVPNMDMLGIDNACGLNDIRRNWSSFLADTQAKFEDPQERNEFVLSTLSSTMEPEINEFAAGMTLYSDTIGKAMTEANTKLSQFIDDSGFRGVANYINGNIETPADTIKDDFYSTINQQKALPNQIGQALMSNTDALLQVGVMAGSVFTNTLLNEMADRIYSGLFEVDFDPDPFDDDYILADRAERAREAYSSLQSFTPLEVTDFNLLSEFSSCSSGVRIAQRRLYNCVINTTFASALALADAGAPLTVQEAIDEGYISGDWALIPSRDKARNQDESCYRYAFCYGNLVKLRKARIISVGWELAADSDQNDESSPITLQEVIDGFDDCNSDSEIDSDHPWCHLIDPDWILVYPQHECRILAYGQQLEANGVDSRAEECVDYQSCIDEDDEGNCNGGYGYCVREKNIWRFRGDSCPEQYASCQSFDTREGEGVDYLTASIDASECGEGNVGCLWYSSVKEENDDGDFDWPEITNTATAELEITAYRERAYFNANIEACDSESAGCTQLIERDEDLNLNLVVNPTFDVDANGDDLPDAWFSTDWDSFVYSTADDIARTGDAAITTGFGDVYQKGITLGQSRFYAFTFFAAQPEGATGAYIEAAVVLTDADGVSTIDLTGTSFTGDCEMSSLLGNNALLIRAQPENDSYERFECIFTAPRLTDSSSLIHAEIVFGAELGQSGDATNVWVDDIQLEQEADASVWHVGYGVDYDDLDYTYVKLPPAYLGCTGESDDPDECDSFAPICTENDAGCNAYTPVSGDPTVFGIVNSLDQCSASCVGYDAYKQEATRFEPDGEFPIYFIPDTADSCSQDAIGCDEFTNLATEEVEYFTYLRGAVTESQAAENTNSDQAAVFYTWEGSDEEGFQLRVWNLLESDLSVPYVYGGSGEIDSDPGNAPCTTWKADDSGINCYDDSGVWVGDLASDTEDCDQHDDIFDNPDCREFYDSAGVIHYRQWSETVSINDAAVTYRKTTVAGADALAWQENCEGSGGFFNTSTNECLYYGFNEESETCAESENGCRNYTGGRSGNSRTALRDTFESDTLDSWDAASAVNVTLSNDSIATDGHSLKSEGTTNIWTHLYDYGSACAGEDGCASGTDTLGAECTVIEGNRYCGTLENDIFTGKTYILTFWAKGDGRIDVGWDIAANTAGTPNIDVDSSGNLIAFGEDIELTDEWQRYSLGPMDMNASDYPDFGNGTVLVFEPDGGVTFWIDNVVLREGEDDITVIMDSWVTPATCDRNLEGESSPQYQLGCQEYIDVGGASAYIKSFSNLCDESQVGCTGFFRSFETETEYAATYNAICSTLTGAEATANTTCYAMSDSSGTAYETGSPEICTIFSGNTGCQFDLDYYIPEAAFTGAMAHLSYTADTQVAEADRDVYAIVSDEFECDSTSSGCSEFGLPIFSADRSVVDSWESAYLVDDPDEYSDTLCESEELFCEEFDSTDEGIFYFKDPQNHVCEYSDGKNLNNATYRGWFREGTSEFCYGTGTCSESSAACVLDSDCADAGAGECNIESGSYVIGGELSGLWRNGDDDYAGWVGLCGPEYDGCSEFRDLLDFDDNEFYGETDGEAYFFVDNQNLDENTLLSAQKCNGQVSQKKGCALFYETGDTSLDYQSSASYIASKHANDLFGDAAYDLVDPIDCSDPNRSSITTPGGEEVDLCAKRCAYHQYNLLSSEDYSEVLDSADSINDLYQLSGSCYSDDDCPGYEGPTGDIVDGSCLDEVFFIFGSPQAVTCSDSSLGDRCEPVTRLENDTNRVLKVSQDRACSEWLTCSSSFTVWDEATASYKTICDGIDLCTDYAAAGDESFCSEWDVEDPVAVLDAERYSARDVTFYGEEYSGYAIPNSYPVQHLSQVNIAPRGYCGGDEDLPCDSDSDCSGSLTCDTQTENDYRLALNAGQCEGGFQDSCYVGYCENSIAPCVNSDDCSASEGECVIGRCYDSTTDLCSSDSDCDKTADEFCLAGVCTTDEGACGISGVCSTGVCFESTITQSGACYRGNCVVSVDGGEFDAELGETKICRAYPESTSPFGNEVVQEWFKSYIDSSGTEQLETTEDVTEATRSWQPYNKKYGFAQAEICTPGEDCDCSYKKLSTRGSSKYLHLDTSTDVDDWSGFGSGRLGICSGGSLDGAFCSTQGISCPDSGGECSPIMQEDSLFGLDGYCLERDSSINILGDPDQNACISWLPVDQLLGSTDLYAKYTGAGYFEGQTEYCIYTGVYADVTASNADSGSGTDWETTADIACVEQIGTSSGTTPGSVEETYALCVEKNYRFTCPPGHYAILGPMWDSGMNEGSYTRACMGRGTEDDDCPLVCVPVNSNIDGDYGACVPTIGSPEYFTDVFTVTDANDYSTSTDDELVWSGDVYIYEDEDDFTEQANAVQGCTAYGIELEEDFRGYSFSPTETLIDETDLSDSAADGWYDYDQDANIYVGCKQTIVVDEGDNISAAPYTDRLLGSNSGFTLNVTDENFAYDYSTGTQPFGKSQKMSEAASGTDPEPPLIASCERTITGGAIITPPSGPTPFDSCSAGTAVGSLTDPEARSFIDFEVNVNESGRREHDFDLFGVWTDAGASEVSTISTAGIITDLFARAFGVLQFDDGLTGNTSESSADTGSYSETTSGGHTEWDNRDEGSPPTVWALDLDNCYGNYCREGDENAVTVGSSNAGDLTASGGYYRATMKFFAAADKDQLPIRRVIVDWGDATGSERYSGSSDSDNYYKNHRGLTDDSHSESYCDTADEWGMTASSCDPNYFTYQHNYTCSESVINTMTIAGDYCEEDENGHITNSPCVESGQCVYQPRVHIRDNWGWCTGVCTLGDDGTNGCFENDVDTLSVPTGYDDQNAECAYLTWPSILSEANDPWVYYDGAIYVEP
ncbi:MAG: hypothetical protein ABIA47_02570 [bacterium]